VTVARDGSHIRVRQLPQSPGATGNDRGSGRSSRVVDRTTRRRADTRSLFVPSPPQGARALQTVWRTGWPEIEGSRYPRVAG
jgi:hypothetical protein